MHIPMPTKICRICKIEKPLEDFYKYANYHRALHMARCKECELKERYPRTTKEPEGKSYAERLANYKEIDKRQYEKKLENRN